MKLYLTLVFVMLAIFVPSSNAACSDPNCISCPGDTTTCKVCKAGYGVIDWYCSKCYDQYCSQCNGDVNTCKVCKVGYCIQNWYCVQCRAEEENLQL